VEKSLKLNFRIILSILCGILIRHMSLSITKLINTLLFCYFMIWYFIMLLSSRISIDLILTYTDEIQAGSKNRNLCFISMNDLSLISCAGIRILVKTKRKTFKGLLAFHATLCKARYSYSPQWRHLMHIILT